MADTKPTENKIILDWTAAKAHLKSLEEKMIAEFSGKDGVNPHLWIAQYVKPLKQRLAVGENSAELFNEVMSLRITTPTVNLLPPAPATE